MTTATTAIIAPTTRTAQTTPAIIPPLLELPPDVLTDVSDAAAATPDVDSVKDEEGAATDTIAEELACNESSVLKRT
jgi:hypothetical protein